PPARPSPNERAENAPRPSRTSGPSADAQSTTDSTGTAAGPAGNLRLPNQSSRHAGAASRRTENQARQQTRPGTSVSGSSLLTHPGGAGELDVRRSRRS